MSHVSHDEVAQRYAYRDFAEFICDYEPERLKNCDNRACTRDADDTYAH